MAVSIASEAASDLDEIWQYVASESASAAIADRLIDAIVGTIFLLDSHPLIGRSRDDLRPGLRGFPVGDYIVLYRKNGPDVIVLHVYHGRRDIVRLLP